MVGEAGRLQVLEALRERLLAADRVSGYNIWGFDFAVIWGVSKEEWKTPHHPDHDIAFLHRQLRPKTDDMLRRIWRAAGLDPDNFVGKTHGGYSLDKIAGATLGATKIGHGADAPKGYQEGKIQRVVNYCADDVALERDLTDFVSHYGYAIVKGVKLVIPPWKGGV